MSFAYLPLYTGDYLRDTRHLTPMRHGIYLLAIMYCWDTQGPMPLDEQEAAGICNCRSSDEVDGLRYVLQRFFVMMDDGWYNKRVADEVARAERISASRSEGGLKSAMARREKAHRGSREKQSTQAEHELNTSSTQVELQYVSPSPSPSPSPSLTKEILASQPTAKPKKCPDFARFWSVYPRKTAKATAERAWAKIAPDMIEIILADVTRRRIDDPQWREVQFIPHPATYLNQKRWEDEIVTAEQAAPKLRTREQWERYGREHGIVARPGESWDEYMTRLQIPRERA